MTGIRVYIIDDHTVRREELALFLSREEGFEVIGTADAPRQALPALVEGRPDAILFDVKMPNRRGLEECRRLVRLHSRPAVIVVTPYADAVEREQVLSAGAAAYVAGDGEREALPSLIRRCVARVRAPLESPAPDEPGR